MDLYGLVPGVPKMAITRILHKGIAILFHKIFILGIS